MTEFLRSKHEAYLRALDGGPPTIGSFRAESIKMGGMFWGYSSMALIGLDVSEDDKSRLDKFVHACFEANTGGFGWSVGHDPHISATHYAVLIMTTLKRDIDEKEKVIEFVAGLQKSDGSFQCDRWGEVDLRFAYDAVCVLSIMDPEGWKSRIDLPGLIGWVLACQNSGDGAFGPNPGLESHAAYTFCALGTLAVADADIPMADQLSHWLCERQTPTGGFNGRPEKAPDVCYSWWILSSLSILKKSHWIDKHALAKFILRAQDAGEGGIADRPDCVPDVFHTFFGIAALSLIDNEKFGLKPVDVRYVIASNC